jgi:hypothetical protein
MLGTFLLYLKVSGMFHLIVGLLHLFGFRLPETHKLYYLAHNFTELWRRINIYWKDFMMSLVFYPVYFRVKQWGPAASVGIATAAVSRPPGAALTSGLAARRSATPQDILFWACWRPVSGARELKPAKSRRRPRAEPRAGLRHDVCDVLLPGRSEHGIGGPMALTLVAGQVDSARRAPGPDVRGAGAARRPHWMRR